MKGRVASVLSIAWYFAKSEMRNRVAGSVGGALWLFLQPLLLILMFFFIFSVVMRIKINSPYIVSRSFSVFMITGLLPWLALQDGIARASVSVLENREVVKKVLLPVVALPIGYCLSAHILYGSVFLIYTLFCLFKLASSGSVGLYKLVVLMLLTCSIFCIQFVMALGIGLLMSGLAVFIRDVAQILPLLLQVWFYATPIVYPEYMVPSKVRFFLFLNPYTCIVESLRSVLLSGNLPRVGMMLYAVGSAVVFFVVGYFVFRTLKAGFADVL